MRLRALLGPRASRGVGWGLTPQPTANLILPPKSPSDQSRSKITSNPKSGGRVSLAASSVFLTAYPPVREPRRSIRFIAKAVPYVNYDRQSSHETRRDAIAGPKEQKTTVSPVINNLRPIIIQLLRFRGSTNIISMAVPELGAQWPNSEIRTIIKTSDYAALPNLSRQYPLECFITLYKCSMNFRMVIFSIIIHSKDVTAPHMASM